MSFGIRLDRRPGRQASAGSRCFPTAGLFAAVPFLVTAIGCERADAPPAPVKVVAVKPWLVERTDASGVEFTHEVGDLLRYEMPQIMGSGGAIIDFDADGRNDLYLIGGEAADPARAPRDRLFRQANDGEFVDVTDTLGLRNVGFGMGAARGDFDNDGFADLYVTDDGPDQLLRNNGDGTFSDVTAHAGADTPGWSTAACFSDYDRDGALDLFVVDYVDYLPGQYCEDRSGRRDFCGPNVYAGTIDRLFRSEGDGRFVDVTSAVGLDAETGKGLGVACRDFDEDGRPDFYVANDMEANHLWLQQPDGTFREEAVARGVALGAMGEAQASMGVIAEDLTGDGRCDLFMTHLRGETNTLYASAGGGYFDNDTTRSGLGGPSRPATGFGVAAVDLRNDGRLHILVVNGRVQRAPALPGTDPKSFWSEYVEPNHLYLNDGAGRYRTAPAEAGRFGELLEASRGLAAGDIDGDGDVDFLVTNCGGPARLFENVAPDQGHFLLVRLVDTKGNRDAIGATVKLVIGDRSVTRVVDPSSGYLTANDIRVHFGLGGNRRYGGIEVTWPDGAQETLPGGEGDRVVRLVRGVPASPAQGADL